MSPWSTSRATPSPGSSPCPSRRPSTAPSITGSGGGSRRCSPTSRPGASGWRTASSVTRSGSRACSWSWRWRCTGRCPPACGRARVSPCRPKKSPGATGAEGGPRPDLALQAWPAPHPTPPAVPRPAPAPLERLAELMDGKVCGECGYALCGHWQPRRTPGREYRYYRCCGTEGYRFHGQRRCDARAVPVGALDGAVWAEVCRVLEDPARVVQEYQRRLEAARTGSRRPELETIDRRIAKLRRGIGRLIDSYAEGIIDKAELEPRLAALRQRAGKLEAEAAALRDAAARTRSLQLVIGRLESFAGVVRDRLATADWATRRDLVRALVRRIEIDDDQVRVVFRVDAGPDDRGGPGRPSQHCPGRDRALALRRDRSRARRCRGRGVAHETAVTGTPADGGAGSATVFVRGRQSAAAFQVGRASPGPRLVQEAFWCGTGDRAGSHVSCRGRGCDTGRPRTRPSNPHLADRR